MGGDDDVDDGEGGLMMMKEIIYLRSYPGRVIHLALLLETELGVSHVYPGYLRSK